MSNQNSSNVTPSLNNDTPPPPPSSPSSSPSSPSPSLASTTSSVLDNVGSFVEGATNRVSELGDQASQALDTASDTVRSSLGTEEPVTQEPVATEEPVINSSNNTLVNPPSTMSTDSLDNIPLQDTFGSTTPKRKRCRNGTRKDKNGDCQPKQAKQTKHRKGAVKSHHMTAKYHELKLENNILIRRQKKAINLTKKLMNYLTIQ